MRSISRPVLVLSLGLFALVSFSACSNRQNISPFPSISETSKQNLAAPVNCDTAHKDIATLEDERASVGRQMLAGVRSVMPISAVAGLLMGDYSARVSVATGQYNRDISAKIDEIRSVCGITAPLDNS